MVLMTLLTHISPSFITNIATPSTGWFHVPNLLYLKFSQEGAEFEIVLDFNARDKRKARRCHDGWCQSDSVGIFV